jgi:hypothetical protein
MENSDLAVADLPGVLVDRQIVRVRRILYVAPGGVRTAHGPIEITIDPELCVLFDAAGNGEDLRARAAAWRDPFASPLSPADETYVQSHGKWTAFDVTDKSPWSALVGSTVRRVESMPPRMAGRPMRGASIVTDRVVLRLEVEADELHAEIAPR